MAAPEPALLPYVAIPPQNADAGIRCEDADFPPIVEAPVEFQAAGIHVRGVLSRPEHCPSPQKALILIHGWGTNRSGPARLLVRMARRAALRGAASLRFDLPGRGESSGEYQHADVDAMLDAVLAAVAFMKERGAGEALLAGICSGANIGLAAAGMNPRDITAVMAMSGLPYQEGRGSAMRFRRSFGHLKGYMKKALKLSTWRRLLTGRVDVAGVAKTLSAADVAVSGGRNLKKSRRNLPQIVSKYPGRLLLVWGEKDPEAPPSRKYFLNLFAGSPLPAEIYIVAGASHNYYGVAAHRTLLEQLDRLLSCTGAGGGTE